MRAYLSTDGERRFNLWGRKNLRANEYGSVHESLAFSPERNHHVYDRTNNTHQKLSKNSELSGICYRIFVGEGSMHGCSNIFTPALS